MSESPATAVLLASGGMDSTTLAYWLQEKGTKIVPLFINYGQHCVETEYETLNKVLPKDCGTPQRVDVSDVYRGVTSRLISEPNLWVDNMEGDPLYLPYRNLLLLSAGAAFAQSRGFSLLYAGFINSNHAKEIDCSAQFFLGLGKMLSEYGSVQVEMPFRDLSKKQVASIGVELKVPLAITYSCQAASKVPCGACPNCVDRFQALEHVQVSD